MSVETVPATAPVAVVTALVAVFETLDTVAASGGEAADRVVATPPVRLETVLATPWPAPLTVADTVVPTPATTLPSGAVGAAGAGELVVV